MSLALDQAYNIYHYHQINCNGNYNGYGQEPYGITCIHPATTKIYRTLLIYDPLEENYSKRHLRLDFTYY